MKYVLLTACSVTLLFAFVPLSFRGQSSAGVLEDDYDRLFDPARILEVDGSRAYTNLSNYAAGNDQQFGANSSNIFLIGGSTSFRDRFAPGAVYDRRWRDTPLFTGLFAPVTGESLFGSARVDSAWWQDLDTNGTYDLKTVTRTERNAWDRVQANDLFFGFGFRVAKSTFGVAFAWNDSTRSSTVPYLDYTLHDYDSSLVAGRLTYLEDDTARYRRTAGFDQKQLVLSARFALKGAQILGLSLAPALTSRDQGHTQYHLYDRDFNPGDPLVPDYERAVSVDTARFPYQGVHLPVQIQLVARRPGRSETWWTLGGFMRSENMAAGAGSRHVGHMFETGNGVRAWFYDTIHSRAQGSSASQGFAASVLRRHFLGEKLDLGYSLRASLTLTRDSLVDSSGSRLAETHDDGDSIPTRNDYTRTSTWAESWLNRTAGRRIQVSLPVGLEYRVIPAVGLRLGAVHTVTWDEERTVNELLSVSPRRVRIDYPDGTFQETVDPLTANPNSSGHSSAVTQSTVFSYGVGFRPIENLQLDLMGFANLTNLAGWRLSATLRF